MPYSPLGRPPRELQRNRDTSAVIRPYSEFGPLGTGDDTTTIQRAWDASAASGGAFQVGQAGDFYVNTLVIRNGLKAISPGVKSCNIISRAASSEEQLVSLDTDIVANVTIKGISFKGNGVAGQHGFRSRAVAGMASGVLQGGPWYVRLEDLELTDFTGETLWFDGGGNDPLDPAAFRAPVQFFVLSSVRAFGYGLGGKRGLRLSGQVGQFEIIGGQLCGAADGSVMTGAETSESVLIERAVNPDGSLNSDIAPYTINFRGVSIQFNKRAVTIERSSGILFDACLFENCREGIHNAVSAFGNMVKASSFYRVGSSAFLGGVAGTGFVVRNAGGLITAEDLRFFTSPGEDVDTHYVSQFNQPIILSGSHVDGSGIRTSGITRQAIASAASIDAGQFDHLFVNGPQATPITTITSDLPPGRLLTVRANAGFIVLGTGGNIDIDPYRAPLRIVANTSVQLLRQDLAGAALKVIAVGGNRGQYRPLQVIVDHSMSPYQVLPGTGTVRVDCTGGDVVIKLPSVNDTPPGENIAVHRYDSALAYVCYINGATTPENPDGQPNNTIRLTGPTQHINFERNGLIGTQSWDTAGGSSLASGRLGVTSAPLTIGAHLTGTPSSTFDGSVPITIDTDATSNNVSSTIVTRDGSNGGFLAGTVRLLHGHFTDWQPDGFGVSCEVGLSGGIGVILAYDRTLSQYHEMQVSGTNINLYAEGGAVQSFAAGVTFRHYGTVAGTALYEDYYTSGGIRRGYMGFSAGSSDAWVLNVESTAASSSLNFYVAGIPAFSADQTNTNLWAGSGALRFFDPASVTIAQYTVSTATWNFTKLMAYSGSVSLDSLPVSLEVAVGTNRRTYMGYDTVNDYGFVAAVHSGTAWKVLYLQPIGGVVHVGPSGLAVDGISNLTGVVTLAANISLTAGDMVVGNGHGIIVASTRRLAATTTGVDVTGTLTSTSTANFISGVLVVTTGGFSTTKPIAINTTGAGTGISMADSSGDTGIGFTPASSSFSVHYINGRVGSVSYFRSSNASGGDTFWLTVTAAGNATFSTGVTFSTIITVTGTANLNGAMVVAGTATFSSTISSSLIPTSGSLDVGSTGSKWRDAFLSGKIELGSTIKTGAPSGGTAAAWKLGSIVSSSGSIDFGTYVELDVGGTLKKLAVWI